MKTSRQKWSILWILFLGILTMGSSAAPSPDITKQLYPTPNPSSIKKACHFALETTGVEVIIRF
ncbi:MAG: hypothetical protein NWR72_08815 [Bacteroidia bacterium]|nr:hypothetical protein [Bacteroidia bacterium]